MSLNDDERNIMVRLEYERSIKLLDETGKIASMEMWNTAASRLYYALFHAVSALLINDGRPVGSHKGTNLKFGQYYIQTGIFPKECGHLYTQMQALRERADYNIMFEATKEDFNQMWEPVKDLVAMIGKRLGQTNDN